MVVRFTDEQQAAWTESDLYHNCFLIPKDEVLDATVKNTAESGVRYEIAVSAAQGKLLNLLARSIKAKKVLEVGTLGGYSAIWLARAVPEDGKIITLELEKKHAEVARQNIENAGLSHKAQVIVGPAAESIEKLGPDGSFDFAFIDADKKNNVKYFIESKRLVRSGGIIVVDNVVRCGLVQDLSQTDESLEGIRAVLRYIQNDPESDATTIATVGEKGYDGFLYAIRK